MRKLTFCSLLYLLPALAMAQPNMQNKFAQKFTEIGIQAGVAGYAGDLGGPLGSEGFRNFEASLLRPSFSVNATHRMADWAAFRPSLTFAMVAGDDNATGDANLGSRNLNFRSVIGELAIVADVNPFYLFKDYAAREHNFYPYFSVGVGAFYFNPQGKLNNEWYDLKPLRLEGQGFPQYPLSKQYSKINFNIPLGAGFKYYISDKHYLGAEGMVRRTFTDYLDDVSKSYIDPAYFDAYLPADDAALARQLYYRDNRNTFLNRGNPKNDDYYFTVALRFGVVLGR